MGFCWGWVVGGYGGGVELGLGLVVGKHLVGLVVLGWGREVWAGEVEKTIGT